MYLDGVYLARPAMEFVQFLDLDRVEVLRGPQGTLYGRNAVGGAMNLISRPPTNDFQASADFTAGNFGELRADARISGPLKRDRVMGSVAFTRGVRDGYVHDLEHPDHPLGGDDVTAARGQLRVVFDRRTNLLLSSDVDDQGGTPLTFNKVLAVKPGFQVDNPPDLHDVRASALAWNRTLQYGASARLTTALTPSTTLVSLTAYRKLDFEFFVDADITELNLLTTHQHEWQHQLSEEITISHEQPRLTWVGGVFLFDEADHQTFWVDQPAGTNPDSARPARRRDQPRGLRTGDRRIDVPALGNRRRSLHARGEGHRQRRRTLQPRRSVSGGSRFGLRLFRFHCAQRLDAQDRPRDEAAARRARLRVGDARVQERRLQPVVNSGRAAATLRSGRGATKADGKARSWAAVPGSTCLPSSWITRTCRCRRPSAIGVFDIRNAAAATIRGVEVENTSRIGRGIEAGGHVTWLDATYDQYIAVANSGATGDVAGNRLNNAPEWAGRLWIEWTGDIGRSRRLSIAADATAQSTVFYTPFNDNIQRQGPYGLLGARVEYGPSHRRWAVAAYARNLTNTDYITATFGTSPAAFGGRPGPSRQFAIDFTVRR